MQWKKPGKKNLVVISWFGFIISQYSTNLQLSLSIASPSFSTGLGILGLVVVSGSAQVLLHVIPGDLKYQGLNHNFPCKANVPAFQAISPSLPWDLLLLFDLLVSLLLGHNQLWVTPGSNWRTIWDTRNWIQAGCIKRNYYTIALVPAMDSNVWNSWVMRWLSHALGDEVQGHCQAGLVLHLSAFCTQLKKVHQLLVPCTQNHRLIHLNHAWDKHLLPAWATVTVWEDFVAIFQHAYINSGRCMHALEWSNDLSVFLELSCTELMHGNGEKAQPNRTKKQGINTLFILKFILF